MEPTPVDPVSVEPTPMGPVGLGRERCEETITSGVDNGNSEKGGNSVVASEKGDASVGDHEKGGRADALAVEGGSKAIPVAENPPTTPQRAIRRGRRSPPPPSPPPSPVPERPAFAHKRLAKRYDKEPDRCPSSWPSSTTLGSEDAPILPRPVAAPLRTRDIDGSEDPQALDGGKEHHPERECPPEPERTVVPKVGTEVTWSLTSISECLGLLAFPSQAL